jgi:predicted nucleic acid-binding protein
VIVVDTNVIASLLQHSEYSNAAATALELERDWRVPSLWRSELRNDLSTAVRTGIFDFSLSLQTWETAEALVAGAEYEPAGFDVLRLAQSSNCTAYDCEYIAVAIDLQASLVTIDQQLLRAFPDTSVHLENFIDA